MSTYIVDTISGSWRGPVASNESPGVNEVLYGGPYQDDNMMFDSGIQNIRPMTQADIDARAAARLLSIKAAAKAMYDAQEQQGRQIRAALMAKVDEFNRHSNCAFAALSVNSQALVQSIPPGTPTIVNAWSNNAASFRATPDEASNQITLGDSGKYMVNLSASYAHTGGGNECDMTWSIYANSNLVPSLQARRRVTEAGSAAAVSIGPLIVNAPSDAMVIDVRVLHNETGARDLVVAHAQFFAMRIPTIPVRSFADLRTAVENIIDAEA